MEVIKPWNRKQSVAVVTAMVLSGLMQTGCGVPNLTHHADSNVVVNQANQTLSSESSSANQDEGNSNSAVPSSPQGPLLIGSKAPDFTLMSANGQSITLHQLLAKGKPILINAWASWCPPCNIETPDLVKASQKYGSKIEFVGVNLTTMDTVGDAKAFVNRYHIPYPILFDTKGNFLDKYTVIAEPMTFVISAQGRVLNINVGMMTSSQMDQLIQNAIGT